MTRCQSVLLVALAPLFPACISFERDAPKTTRYVLELDPPETTAPRRDLHLGVRPFHVAAAYADRKFLYRTARDVVETDFYHEFMTAPAIAIEDAVTDWLFRSGAFAMVSRAGTGAASPDWLLEGDIVALYGDTRGPRPQAVLELRLTVLDADTSRVIATSTEVANATIPDDSPEALVAGWRRALAECLERFIRTVPQR